MYNRALAVLDRAFVILCLLAYIWICSAWQHMYHMQNCKWSYDVMNNSSDALLQPLYQIR